MGGPGKGDGEGDSPAWQAALPPILPQHFPVSELPWLNSSVLQPSNSPKPLSWACSPDLPQPPGS